MRAPTLGRPRNPYLIPLDNTSIRDCLRLVLDLCGPLSLSLIVDLSSLLKNNIQASFLSRQPLRELSFDVYFITSFLATSPLALSRVGKPVLTIITLKMYDHQHVNKYMIEFSKHATHTGWNDAALYGESIETC